MNKLWISHNNADDQLFDGLVDGLVSSTDGRQAIDQARSAPPGSAVIGKVDQAIGQAITRPGPSDTLWPGFPPGLKGLGNRPEQRVAWEVELPWPNRTGNRAVRHGGGGHYLSREAAAYRGAVRRHLEARRLADLRLVGPYHVQLVLRPPDARARDGDNLEKVLWDALVKAGLLADDSNAVLPVVSRQWVEPEKPGSIFISARYA